MGILSKTGDLVYTLRFLRLLTTRFEDTNAFKLGLIDKDGNKLKKAETSAEKDSYNTFHRLAFNLKKLIGKVPGGKSSLASYASALFLIKENLDLGDDSIQRIVEECSLDLLADLQESDQWFLAKDGMLSPGKYTLKTSKVINSTIEEVCKSGDTVVAGDESYPVGNLFGLDVFEVVHESTNQKVFVCAQEIER